MNYFRLEIKLRIHLATWDSTNWMKTLVVTHLLPVSLRQSVAPTVSLADMQQAQTADPVISVILQRVATRVRPPYEAIQRTGHQIKAFWHKYDELFFMMDFCSDIRVTIVRRYNWWCPQSLFLLSFGNYIPVSLLAILG